MTTKVKSTLVEHLGTTLESILDTLLSGIQSLAASAVTLIPSGGVTSTNVQSAIQELDSDKQNVLVSGSTIKTVNGTTLLGSGDITISGGGGSTVASDITFTPAGNVGSTNVQFAIQELDSEKQATLTSGTNIKTVNGVSLLGSGNLNLTTGTGDFTLTPGSGNSIAAASIAKTMTAPTNDRRGILDATLYRTGGSPGNASICTYFINVPGAYDVGTTSIVSLNPASGNAGGAWAMWPVACGPAADIPHSMIGIEVNTIERARDYGRQFDRTTQPANTIGILIVPEKDIIHGTNIGYNQTFGLAFAKDGDGTRKTHVPLFFEKDCTVPGGIQALHKGGSSEALGPESAINIQDSFDVGVELSYGTYHAPGSPAIRMAAGHTIYQGLNSLDLGGSTDAFMGISGTNRIGTPSNTSTPTGYIAVYIDGVRSFFPFYR